MHVLFETNNIDIYVVASFQHVTVWNTMTYTIIYSQTH